MAYRSVRTLSAAVAIAGRSGGGGVLVDALHVQRCGVPLAALRAVDPALISYVQLCDAPLAAPGAGPASADAMREARAGRLLPGRASCRCGSCLTRCPTGYRSRSRRLRRATETTAAVAVVVAVWRSSRRGRGGRWMQCFPSLSLTLSLSQRSGHSVGQARGP